MADPKTTVSYTIPKSVDLDLRSFIRRVYKENPHLKQNHMDAVVRLAKLTFHFNKLHEHLSGGSYTIETESGEKANPRNSMLTSVQNAIVTQERQLGIAFRAQREMLSVDERGEQEEVSNKPAHTARGAPKLKLA